jgi:hypothetical protein
MTLEQLLGFEVLAAGGVDDFAADEFFDEVAGGAEVGGAGLKSRAG